MGELHQKPTREELIANANKALKEAEAMPADPPPSEPIPSEPVPSEPVPSEPVPEEPKPSEPIPSEPVPSEPVPSEPVPDYKKKFSESSREAQVQGFKNKEINDAVEEAAAINDITDEEIKKEYPDWDTLTATEQRFAKDNLINKKRFELIHAATSKFKKVDEWNGKVKIWVGDPKTLIAHPELEGKTEEFEQFAGKPTRRGVDFDDLVLAFLGERAKNKVVKKGKMFETGQGGGAAPKEKVNDGKISALEGRALMKSNYKKYVEMLKAGKIRNE